MYFVRKKTRNRWVTQIQKNASSVTRENGYSFIDQYIKDKRIILLGENCHGVANYYSTKIDIIRYLHENHGYNVVVFESGLLEATMCEMFLSNHSTEEKIRNGFLDIFHNEEMKALFTGEWAQHLKISGMDVQPTYPLISEYMLEWVKDHTDNDLYNSLKKVEMTFFELDKEMMYKVTRQLKSRMKVLIEEYQKWLVFFNSKRMKYAECVNNRMLELIHRGMINRVQWLKTNLKGYLSSGILRGKLMFENLEWLLDNYYKNEKVIVWAHNFHIRKKQTWPSKLLGIKSVGHLLRQNRDNDCFSLGLYAGSGNVASLLRVDIEIDTTKKNHLESLLDEASQNDIFLPLDIINQKGKKNMWYDQKWWLLESGLMSFAPKVLYPQEHYDALLFFKDVRPPLYFNHKKSEEGHI